MHREACLQRRLFALDSVGEHIMLLFSDLFLRSSQLPREGTLESTLNCVWGSPEAPWHSAPSPYCSPHPVRDIPAVPVQYLCTGLMWADILRNDLPKLASGESGGGWKSLPPQGPVLNLSSWPGATLFKHSTRHGLFFHNNDTDGDGSAFHAMTHCSKDDLHILQHAITG